MSPDLHHYRYEDPATLFVAGFIGSPRMNLLRGKANGDGVPLEAGPVVPFRGSAGDVRIGFRSDRLMAFGPSGERLRSGR